MSGTFAEFSVTDVIKACQASIDKVTKIKERQWTELRSKYEKSYRWNWKSFRFKQVILTNSELLEKLKFTRDPAYYDYKLDYIKQLTVSKNILDFAIAARDLGTPTISMAADDLCYFVSYLPTPGKLPFQKSD